MAQKTGSETPLMTQHKSIKAKFPDAILLFRVGDFYETFGADAIITAKVLGITLTKRNNGDKANQELAGFPYHALDIYLHKLVKAGYRVAICDQLEDPKLAKGIVKRGVIEVVTPGIASDEKLLDQSSNNYLCALCESENLFGVAFLDITTGDFFVAEGNEEYIDKLFQSLKPTEILFSKKYANTFSKKFSSKLFTYQLDDWLFAYDYSLDKLLQHFKINSLKGFGIQHLLKATIAAGVIIHYLQETEHRQLQHLNNIHRIEKEDCLWLDKFTIRNLELFATPQDPNASLIKTMDNTVSPMGARLLKKWLVFPLNNLASIATRLNTVSYLIEQKILYNILKTNIAEAGDMERFVAKIPLKKINPRELRHIAKGLNLVENIKTANANCENELLQRLSDGLNPCNFIATKINQTLVENPPLNSNKGELISRQQNKTLDDLKDLLADAKKQLAIMQEQEIEATGINSLKINFNNVYGYYLEVSNSHKKKVPETWLRKQTLVNAERYITPELKAFEEKIMGAEEKIIFIESTLYNDLLTELQDYIPAIQLNAQCLAQMDCLLCFAHNAITFNYCKPEVNEDLNIEIVEGRHPVIERNMKKGETYIPNTIKMDVNENQIIILTGPNMSGKSAILRQVALTILLAHIGSFVPCQKAVLPLTDKIFTRVGASDNISEGESTFMVEMNETASILNNISQRSLILLDEIGRGTSTYDGISIAWSMVEYLHNHHQFQPKTLFATHYHELNELEKNLSRVKNYHVSYAEANNKVIFLRKLAQGGIRNSFGIQVATMAGFPQSIILRAQEILHDLEKKGQDKNNNTKPNNTLFAPNVKINMHDTKSMELAGIKDFFYNTDLNTLTPIEALMKLNELKKKLQS